MEKKFKLKVITVLLVIAPLFLIAQTPPHPNNGNSPASTTNTPVGAGAPVADGQLLLLVLVIAYAVRKIYLIPADPKKA